MRSKRNLANTILFLLTTYVYGIIIGVLFYFLRVLGMIQVVYPERFPRWKRKLILVSNHPSLLEPFFLPALFFPAYLFFPFKYGPWSTPDRKNFYDKWYWYWLRTRAIPINRGNKREELAALFQMKKILDVGEPIILFPEGGRTSTGEKRGEKLFFSKKGHKIRKLKESIGWLALTVGANIVPVWVEGTEKIMPDWFFSHPRNWRRIKIKIGKPMEFQRPKNKNQITKEIMEALLKLADKEE